MLGELNVQQEEFVRHYLQSGNAQGSAIKAGYSRNGADRAGYRLVNTPKIKERIEAARAKAQEKTQMSYQRMLASLMDFTERAKRDDRPSAMSAEAKGYELICKMEGYFDQNKKEAQSDYKIDVCKPEPNAEND
jgi:phage terminase small subunit